MDKYKTSADSVQYQTGKSEKLIELLLIALLAFMPFAFGADKNWAREIVIVLSGAISICFLLKYLYRGVHRDFRIIPSRAYIPAAIFIIIVIVQLIPLPAGVVSLISPNTTALKTELLSDIQQPDRLSSMTLSFYPNATRHDLRILLALAAVFFVALNTFKNINQIKRILWAITLIGGFVALLALAHELFGNGKIYWLIPLQKGITSSGPFVNHSHYGQFMNLSLGAALGLLMVKLNEAFRSKRMEAPAVFEYLSSGTSKTIWVLIAIISLGAATVFTSLSRGGMISMLAAGIVTTIIVSFRKSLKGYGWLMALTALIAFVCILYTGFDAVYERLASLRNLDPYNNRLQIVKDLTACFRRFPVLGTGMGTHEVVYPMYDSSTITATASHVENEYVQVLEETGLAGLVTLIVLGIIISAGYTKNIRSKNRTISGITYGLGFGLIAILVHSITDFGQHMPANAFLSAIFCAIILTLANIEQSKEQSRIENPSHNRRWLKALVCCGVIGIWTWALLGANNARIAEGNWKEVQKTEKELTENNWQGTDEQYNQLTLYASKAVEAEPDNAIYQYWLTVYRWRSINKNIENPWCAIPEESIPSAYDVAEQLKEACLLCPTFGPSYCVLGQLELFILEDDAGLEKIRKGFMLAPCDPVTCFAAGYADVIEEKYDQSLEKFKKVVELDDKYFQDVVNVYINSIDRPDLAVAVAGNDTNKIQFISSLLIDTEYKELQNELRQKLIKLFEEQCARPGASASSFAYLAEIYSREEDKKATAAEYYSRALALNYGVVRWRLNLTKLLAEMGRINEAMHEARVCLKIRPELKEAENLIAELSVRQVPAEDEKTNSFDF